LFVRVTPSGPYNNPFEYGSTPAALPENLLSLPWSNRFVDKPSARQRARAKSRPDSLQAREPFAAGFAAT
jgi:hypothetical protein